MSAPLSEKTKTHLTRLTRMYFLARALRDAMTIINVFSVTYFCRLVQYSSKTNPSSTFVAVFQIKHTSLPQSSFVCAMITPKPYTYTICTIYRPTKPKATANMYMKWVIGGWWKICSLPLCSMLFSLRLVIGMTAVGISCFQIFSHALSLLQFSVKRPAPWLGADLTVKIC